MRCACYAVCPSWAALPLLLHQHLASMGSSASSSGAPPSRGAFILFEGVDRCGKSTQSARLVDGLNAAGVRARVYFVFMSSSPQRLAVTRGFRAVLICMVTNFAVYARLRPSSGGSRTARRRSVR